MKQNNRWKKVDTFIGNKYRSRAEKRRQWDRKEEDIYQKEGSKPKNKKVIYTGEQNYKREKEEM